MIYYLICITLFAIASGALTYYAIQAGGNRPALVSIFCGLVFFGLAVSADLLGLPKPMWLEVRSLDNSPIVGVYADKPSKTVYLWAVKDGVPKAYYYPWVSDQESAKLQQDFREGGPSGDTLVLSDEDHRHYKFKAQPRLPSK